MKLQDFVSQCAREAGLPMVNEREAHIYAQSVMPKGTADIEITPEKEPIFKEVFLKVMREARENPGPLADKVDRQIMGN